LAAALAAATGVSGCVRTLVEMAFLDRAARRRGQPVWALLGLPEPGEVRLMTTVPINEELPSSGLLKIKLGGPGDAAVLRRLAAVDGPIVLDVNRGWDEARWTELAPLVAELAPAVIEDPVGDPGLLPRVRAALPGTAVVLDEGIAGQADVERAIEVAGGANVKVMKLGGLFPARRALARLAEAGATRMLGCYLEPPRAIAYSALLAGLADWTDLDGHFWLCDDPKVTRFRLGGGPGIPSLVYPA
ncbi:MAG TPA: enolase C-terminal domain-like protein, partial [Micromonosporaceae bacterium]|nr:enolase C-terminal domain-like protein [Micromonosporaceae bacterium]